MTNAFTNTITLGAMSGVRSMAGPVTAAELDKDGLFARGRVVVDALVVLESLADKFAPLPPRTSAIPLLGRAATGAALGYFVNKRNRVAFALLGAAAAAAAAFVAVEVRRTATKKLRIPDFLMGLAEDAALAGVGLRLVHASRK